MSESTGFSWGGFNAHSFQPLIVEEMNRALGKQVFLLRDPQNRDRYSGGSPKMFWSSLDSTLREVRDYLFGIIEESLSWTVSSCCCAAPGQRELPRCVMRNPKTSGDYQ